MTKNRKKFTAEKKIKFLLDKKTTIYLSLGFHKGRPSYKRSLQLSKENIHHFKTWNFLIYSYFCGSFLPSWIRIRFRIHWPDWILIRFGSGSATLLKRKTDPLLTPWAAGGLTSCRRGWAPCWPRAQAARHPAFRTRDRVLSIASPLEPTEIIHDPLLFSVAQGLFWLSTERLSPSTLHLKEWGEGRLYSCTQ